MRLLRDRVDSGYPVLEPLSVSYGAGMTGHTSTPRRIAGIESQPLFSIKRVVMANLVIKPVYTPSS